VRTVTDVADVVGEVRALLSSGGAASVDQAERPD
jgi:hypothetical protein